MQGLLGMLVLIDDMLKSKGLMDGAKLWTAAYLTWRGHRVSSRSGSFQLPAS